MDDVIGTLMPIIIITLVTILLVNLGLAYCKWNYQCSELPRMKFKHWRDIYYLNSKRWTLYYKGPEVRTVGNTFSVGFSFIDWLRYRLFCRAREKQRKKARDNECIQKVLETAQRDIEVLKDIANREMEEAARMTKEVANRMGGQ